MLFSGTHKCIRSLCYNKETSGYFELTWLKSQKVKHKKIRNLIIHDYSNVKNSLHEREIIAAYMYKKVQVSGLVSCWSVASVTDGVYVVSPVILFLYVSVSVRPLFVYTKYYVQQQLKKLIKVIKMYFWNNL